MPKNFKRTDRIAEMLQRELAKMLQQDIKAAELPKFITISAVKIAKDLKHAKVYFTVFDHDSMKTAAVLNTMANQMRMLLAKRLSLRSIPQLHFVYDESIEYGKRLSRLIDEVNKTEYDQDKSAND